MILVKMQIAEGVDELTGAQPTDLRDHHREQRIGGDVERHAEKQIGAALIKLAAQFSVLHVELKQRVTRRQRHLVGLRRIPRAYDQPPALRIFLDLLDDVVDLIYARAVWAAPVHPLRAVDAAEIAVLVRPLIPDRDSVLAQKTNVRLAAQEPEQLVND